MRYTPMRCTPVSYTPMRYTPVSYIPMRYTPITPVVPISEVMPSRGVRALEGEGRGLSHLEVIARGVCGAS